MNPYSYHAHHTPRGNRGRGRYPSPRASGYRGGSRNQSSGSFFPLFPPLPTQPYSVSPLRSEFFFRLVEPAPFPSTPSPPTQPYSIYPFYPQSDRRPSVKMPNVVHPIAMNAQAEIQHIPSHCTLHPPFYNVGEEVLYNKTGFRTKDENSPPTAFSWRQWRTYIIRRNDYLTSEGNWVYQVLEVGGSSVAQAAEEDLVELPFLPQTRVKLAREWDQPEDKIETKWVVQSCRLMGSNNPANILYDVRNENGDSIQDEKFNVRVTELVPYANSASSEGGVFGDN